MKQFILAVIVLTIHTGALFGQSITISGTVTDAKTGEALIGAYVTNTTTNLGAVTNVYGFYSYKTNSGQCKISVSYIGYQPIVKELTCHRDTVIAFKLDPSVELSEVQVVGERTYQSVNSTQMSMVELKPSETEKLPVLLGESDIIKTLQLTPGVKGGTEGSSGFYVRGGGPDQNLILIDGVPVYNVNHLFGFLSVFNSDAIKNVSLIKGGFPARYGGRLSSVVDIRMKEGNNQEFKGEASIGLLSAKLTLEGPIVKDKTSFMVSGRRSYIDVLSYPIQMMAKQSNPNNSTWASYYMQDFNGKINHTINDKHKLYFSIYSGKDKMNMENKYEISQTSPPLETLYEDKIDLQWGNLTSALRWNYFVSNTLFCNVSATVSDYRCDISSEYKSHTLQQNFNNTGRDSVEDTRYYSSYKTRIRDYGLKADFDYCPNNKHLIKFGIGSTLQYFSPGVSAVRDESNYNKIDTVFGNTNMAANLLELYIEDDFSIGSKVKVNAGGHLSYFTIQNANYSSLEPRLAVRYLVTPAFSLKTSFSAMEQYLHLLSNSSFGLPTDLWVPATKNIKPQNAWQTGVGANYALSTQYEFSLEGYYKKMNNLIEYADGASYFDLSLNNWEELIVVGEGESYGAELFAQKKNGVLTGWLAYTLSWSNRLFADINNGQMFPSKYDSRHDISIVGTYKFNNRVDVGATWVYHTGYRFTLEDEQFASPLGKFAEPGATGSHHQQGPSNIGYFESRNNYKLPDYHRLDLGVNLHKQKKKYLRTWSFGVYNAYAKNNAFINYTSEKQNPTTGSPEIELKQLNLLSIIPYARWSIKF